MLGPQGRSTLLQRLLGLPLLTLSTEFPQTLTHLFPDSHFTILESQMDQGNLIPINETYCRQQFYGIEWNLAKVMAI